MRTETMTVGEYKGRWMSGHEHPEVLRAEKNGLKLEVETKNTPFGNFAVAIKAIDVKVPDAAALQGRIAVALAEIENIKTECIGHPLASFKIYQAMTTVQNILKGE